jgi:hypothetical protein
MPVMASTASVSARPWSMHGEHQVQNEVAWPMTAQPATVVLGAPERRRQNVAEVAVPAAPNPPGTTPARSQTPVRLS